MTSAARRRLQALSKQLKEGIPDEGTFENIPKIRHVVEGSTEQRVKGKVVVVTGANSPLGIGRAAAHLFAQHGAKAVYLCDYSDNFLATHRRELNSLYPAVQIHTRQLDVGDETSVKDAIDKVINEYGQLDIMFANAGVTGAPTTYDKISADDFQKTMRTNALGVFLCAKYAALAMQKVSEDKPYPSGSIIGSASVAGLRSNAGSTDYSASKAAVISIAQTLSFQLSGTGIRVNAICPGLTETGMTEPLFVAARASGKETKIGQLNPLKRGAIADEIARVALFLGSDEASYVNGQAWAVCGGLSAGHPFVMGRLA